MQTSNHAVEKGYWLNGDRIGTRSLSERGAEALAAYYASGSWLGARCIIADMSFKMDPVKKLILSCFTEKKAEASVVTQLP